MINSISLKWFYGIATAVFIILLTGTLYEFYWIYLLPLGVFIVLAAFYRMDWLMLFTVFLVPLSINLQKTNIGIGVSLPAEPLIFGMMLMFFVKLAHEGKFDRKITTHPVSILILMHLVWMTVTTVFSTMPVVSVKATLARICFVTVYYFFATQLFRKYGNIKKFVWLYVSTLLVVVVYCIVQHAYHHWTEEAAHSVMYPFYNDHTAYAAALALFVPLMIAFMFDKTSSYIARTGALVVLITLITAIVLSYTRAAWVSLAAALISSLAFLFRIKTSIILSIAVVFVLVIISYWTRIIIQLESNTEHSSTDYKEHISSISNISTDASNVERINRWLCALRMFKEKPVMGWGPGTYQFQYGPFQRQDEKTYISTNAGDAGSSHSEYLGPLSEQGVLGCLLFISIGITVAFQCARYTVNTKNKRGKLLARGLLLGLVTYWAHGFLNYFLDTDKASVPFWGFIAAIVALQVYHNKGTAQNESHH